MKTIILVLFVAALILAFSSNLADAVFSTASLFGTASDKVRVVFIADFEDEADKASFFSDPSRVVPLGLNNGSKYQCHIPERVSTEESDKIWRKHLLKLQNRPIPHHLAKKIDSALSELCFTYPDGWWSYKLCWGKSMRQFHEDTSGKVEAEFYIGKGPEMEIEDGATEELLYDVDPSNPTRARLVAEWFNGTVCDVTNRERHMILYLQCPSAAGGAGVGGNGNGKQKKPNHQTSVHSTGNAHANLNMQAEMNVVETGSCEYEATLVHQAFCSVPELQSREKPESLVRCIEVSNTNNNNNNNINLAAISMGTASDEDSASPSISVAVEGEEEVKEEN
jgi:hypothetical protein